MGSLGSPETWERNYHSTLLQIPQQRSLTLINYIHNTIQYSVMDVNSP
jgi:hypothetical protein